jgi:hypothetical protein
VSTHKEPAIDPETGRYAVSPTQEWRACPCKHLAWRTDVNTWECACPLSGGCHPPGNRQGEYGPELVYLPFRFGDAAYVPPDAS